MKSQCLICGGSHQLKTDCLSYLKNRVHRLEIELQKTVNALEFAKNELNVIQNAKLITPSHEG